MAGIRVTVCLPAEARSDLPAAIGEALAPFELLCGFGWRGMWDWWAIRGGSEGFGFSVLPGFEGDPRLVHDDPRVGTPLPSLPGTCAGGPRELLDVTGLRAQSARVTNARTRLDEAWEVWHALAAEHPPLVPWSVFHARRKADPRGYPVESMNTDFRSQPLLQAFLADPVSSFPGHGPLVSLERQPFLFDAFAQGAWGLAQLSEQVARQGDVLTPNGWWIEDGWRPLHATCESADTCPHLADGLRYQRDLADYLLSLPDDTLLIKLKCHG